MAKYTALEKELLVLKYKKSNVKISNFCSFHNVSVAALKKWILIYDEFGIEGFDKEYFSKLVGKNSQEVLVRENLRLRIENERLKKGYAVRLNGEKKEFVTLKDPNSK